MKIKSAFAIALMSLSLLPAAAAAQFNNAGGNRVCFYSEPNYRGGEQCYNAGYEISNFGGRRVTIRSFRIFGGAVVAFFDNPGFGGRYVEFDSDIPDVARYVASSRNWNGRFNSIRISQRIQNPGRGNRGGRGQQARDVICVYEHVNYRGYSECFQSGAQVRDFGRFGGWNDRISSVRVFGRASALFYQDVGFGGREIYINQDISDLGRIRMDRSDSWNDQISSVYVENTSGGGGNYGRLR